MSAGDLILRFERLAPSGDYGIARRGSDGERWLAPAPADVQGECRVAADACHRLSPGMDDETALRLPAVAWALDAWERLGLELGEAAVLTSGSASVAALAAVARWRCGRPAIWLDLGGGTAPPAGVAVADSADPQAAIEWLGRRLRALPGAAAIVLGASAKAADLLLETLPAWGRIGIAVGSMDRTAIDFYNRVHRSCSTLLGLPATAAGILDPARREAAATALRRAEGLLGHPALARALAGAGA